MNMNELQILGNLLNNTYGRQSSRDAGYAIGHKIGSCPESGKTMLNLRFETAVNWNPRHGMDEQKKKLDKESEEVISRSLKELKSNFKDSANATLKCTEVSPISEATVDVISINPSLIRARYRRSLSFYLES